MEITARIIIFMSAFYLIGLLFGCSRVNIDNEYMLERNEIEIYVKEGKSSSEVKVWLMKKGYSIRFDNGNRFEKLLSNEPFAKRYITVILRLNGSLNGKVEIDDIRLDVIAL